MNPVYLEVAALIVLAAAVLWIARQLAASLASLLEPFRALSKMQETVLQVQRQAIEAQKEASASLSLPYRALGEMQEKVLEVQRQAIEAQKQASASLIEPYRALSELQSKSIGIQQQAVDAQMQAIEAQKQSVAAHGEAVSTLRIVIQRSLEVSEHADRSSRKLSAAHELYKGKVAELEQARETLIAELVSVKQVAADFDQSRDEFIKTTKRFAALEGAVETYHQATLDSLTPLASNDAVLNLKQFMTSGLRELLVRDLSRAATMYPRRIRIDLLGSGIDSLGKVDGGEFLGILKRVRFQLVCEAGNCDKRGNHYLSDLVYEIKQSSFFVGTLRKISGMADPGNSVFEGLNRFDETITNLTVEGGNVVLYITAKLSLPQTVAVIAAIKLDASSASSLERLRKGVSRPEDVKDLWQLIQRNDFIVRDIGGSSHAQLGTFIESTDENRNQPLFGGLCRILDPQRGYMWVCPSHAQEFMDTLREVTEQP